MSRYSRISAIFGLGGAFTPAVKTLLMACVIAYLLQIFDQIAGNPAFTYKFGLTPEQVTGNFYLWQPVTYIFLHGGFFHILFNMFALWMFGADLERLWGTRQFTKFFFICGVGAALTTIVTGPDSKTITIGASGSIYGILLAYGLLFPDRIIFINFIIPMKAKYYVMIMGALTFISSLSATGGGIAHIAHLGGMIFGLLYLRGGRVFSGVKWRYQRWQRNRLRKKFEVYYSQRHEDEERWRRWRN